MYFILGFILWLPYCNYRFQIQTDTYIIISVLDVNKKHVLGLLYTATHLGAYSVKHNAVGKSVLTKRACVLYGR